MENINYIKHLNGVFLLFSKDGRLNPTHISLYVALFQLWNNYHFPQDFYVNRDEVMQFSKIGSKTTYHRCIKELNHWKYIAYEPSHNPFHGSKIKMFNFGTSNGPVLYPNPTNNGASNEQAVVSINKPIQTLKNTTNDTKLDNPKNQNEVIDFFERENWPQLEAKKFFNHYQGIGWRIGGKSKIVDWKATAYNWMLKADELKMEKAEGEVGQQTDNLKTGIHKNYHEPL
ncbi:hypothetical protein [Pareuzebyella sediminis]|uniref:hypothetical protein n=1 Tax=Pareuzebyella sediminis TaxID=2607998 RepID=UPI0018E1505B|nr:hypothetical protein [Pareuzebyella sediminis]